MFNNINKSVGINVQNLWYANEYIYGNYITGDGSIDENEFCTVCDHYGISRQESSAAYKKFSKVSTYREINRYYTYQELMFEDLFTQYWRGEVLLCISIGIEMEWQIKFFRINESNGSAVHLKKKQGQERSGISIYNVFRK